MPKLLGMVIVLMNIVGFIMETLYIHPNTFDNILILGMLALSQSFMNAIIAGICITVRYFAKTITTQEKLTIIINALWISTALSVLLAIGYCFIGGPLSHGKTSNIMS